jgi:hypothetical protein
MNSPSDLSSDVHLLYTTYGDAIHLLGPEQLRAKAFARKHGVTEWSARKLRQAVEDLGPPSERADIEGAMVLVVPDSHAGPGQDLRRFTWLGRAIEHYGRVAMSRGVPFRVVWIGDTGDYHSLSSYDKGKLSAEGARYVLDLQAHKDAMTFTYAEVSSEVWAYADLHYTKGNHEFRANRHMQDHPELEGVLDGPMKLMEGFGITAHEFLDIVTLDGVAYVHYMQNPGTGKAVGGINQARSMLLKGLRSIVVGHSHKIDSFTQNDLYGNPVKTLVVGCYFEHDEGYAGQGNRAWWRGLVLLENVRNGNFDETPLRMDTVRKRFGDK